MARQRTDRLARGAVRRRATARCSDAAPIALHLIKPKRDGGGLISMAFPPASTGVPERTASRQSALIGVYLAEARPNMGNLTMWPGSRRRIASFTRDIGAPGYRRRKGAEALLAAAMKTTLGEPEQPTVAPVTRSRIISWRTVWLRTSRFNFAVRVYFRRLHRDDGAS